jgi:hypothetical protein
VTVQEQLPSVSLGRRGRPDPRKAILGQKPQQQLGIAPVGLLLPLATGANLRRIPDPYLVSQLRQHPLEPLRLPAGFDPHSYGPLQPRIKGPHLLLSLVTQRLLHDLSDRQVQRRDLLIARMKIAAYNLHLRLLSPEPWSLITPKPIGSKEPMSL